MNQPKVSKGKLLFVDNDPDFLNARAELVENTGYQVQKAYTLAQARQFLADTWFHLLIVDIRMTNDDDKRDFSGLTLVEDEAYHTIPKIILTGFPTAQALEKALGLSLKLPSVVGFLKKEDGFEATIQTLDDAFAHHVRINPALSIHQAGSISLLALINLIEPGVESSFIPAKALELEDLFRRLFFESSQLTLFRLISARAGRVALAVSAFSAEGIESQFVVACGEKTYLQAEQNRYDKLSPRLSRDSATVKIGSAETLHFGAIAYSLTGECLEAMVTLIEFYRRNPLEKINSVLANLFQLLATWHQNNDQRDVTGTLAQIFGDGLGVKEQDLLPAELERRIKRLSSKTPPGYAEKIEHLLPKLMDYLFQKQKVSTRFGLTYGRVDGQSVLVNQQGRVWLIDFSQVQWGALLGDFVSLETVIKFEWGATLDPHSHEEIEKRLVNLEHLDQPADTANLEPELQKTLQTVSLVRRYAVQTIGQDKNTYFAALLLGAVGQLAAYKPEMWYTRSELGPFLQALLTAVEICQKLTPVPPDGSPHRGLWIDELNHEVWVDGRQVKLSQTRYRLLTTLYRQANQLCTFETISWQVYNMKEYWHMKGTIHAEITRLRKEIERDPQNPKYIIAVRGRGYKLLLA